MHRAASSHAGEQSTGTGCVFIGDFLMERTTLLNSTFQVQWDAVLYQLGQCCYAGTKPHMCQIRPHCAACESQCPQPLLGCTVMVRLFQPPKHGRAKSPTEM